MKSLELRVPPPAVATLALALMWGIDRALPALRVDFAAATPVAIVLAVGGLALEGWGLVAFFRARTTFNPLRPERASALVAAGPYRFTRNPMYLGWLPVLAGWATWLRSPASLVVLPLFVAYLTRFQIVPEERALRARFGAAYEEYVARVRRWL